jgi:hypothetical protein
MRLVSAATNLFESPDMTSVYNLLRETCGISQAEAAEFVHEARLDSVKSWCSDRRPAPAGVVRELKELAGKINIAGAAYAAQLKSSISKQPLNIGIPHDELDARHCGFPSLGASLRAVSVAIMDLPDGIEIHVGPRVRGLPPINLISEVVETAFAIHQTAMARRLEQYTDESGAGERRALGVIDEFKIAGGDVNQLMRFYRDEFDDPRDVGFRVLEKVLLSPAPVTN